jgi:putative flippase GtrA
MLTTLNRWLDVHKKTFSLFVLTGATSAAVNIGLFAVFWSWLRFNYLVAVTLAYGFAVIVHFNMNRRLTFRCHGANFSSHLTKYIIMLTINFMITLLIVNFTVKGLHWSPYWSVVVSIGVTMMISYYLARNWVFK